MVSGVRLRSRLVVEIASYMFRELWYQREDVSRVFHRLIADILAPGSIFVLGWVHGGMPDGSYSAGPQDPYLAIII